jgi:hypothetical protein
MNKRLFTLVLATALVIGTLSAQNVLKPSSNAPTIDGSITQGEYPVFGTVGGITIGASLSADGSVLSLAVEAPTTGWVALGLGSSFMDGSYIVMGYEAGGKPAITEQKGFGHSHGAVQGTKLLRSAVHETGGTTVLEFQVKAADFVKGGQLPLIMAYGRTADFVSRHQRYATTTLSIQK